MSDDRDDLLTELRNANPVPASLTAGRRESPEAEALLRGAMRQRVRPSRAVLIAAVIVLVLLLLAALTGFLLVRRSSAEQAALVACFGRADVHAKAVVVAAGDDPRASCRRAWAVHKLGAGPAPKNYALCVLRTGGLAVFPGESGTTCERLALPLARPGMDTAARLSRDLAVLQSPRCVGRAEALATVRDRLRREGLTNWSVRFDTSRAFGKAFPCASIAIDGASRTVSIVAIPRLR